MIEASGLLLGFAPELPSRGLDRRLVTGRKVDEARQEVARAPLQPRRKALQTLLEGLAIPADASALSYLLGVTDGLRHQVVGRMAFREVGLQQGVGVGVEAGALEQIGGGSDDRLALVAIGDLAVGTRRLLAHVGDERGLSSAARIFPAAPGFATGFRQVNRCAQVDLRNHPPACDRRATTSHRLRAASARRRTRRAAPCAQARPTRSRHERSRPRSW